jgi:uracil-DNA glycosylase
MPDHKDYPGAVQFVPGSQASLATVARAAQDCQGCDLYERATQTVFGEVTVVPTIHPSAVLRADDRDAAYAGLVSDLSVAAAALPGGRAG